jgi:uncharacterized protein
LRRLKWIFAGEHGLRAGWRFGLFVALFAGGGQVLNWALERLHLADRAFTWSGLLQGEVEDLALVAAVAWVISKIAREPYSSYGLPLIRGSGGLFLKGLWWGFVPSVLILAPIYLAGGCSFHGVALPWRDLAFYAAAWALAFIAVGFAEEFLFRGCALKTLAEGIGFWPAAVILSSIFGLVHLIFKPHEDWIDPLSISLYGIFWCLTLRRTGSLWFAVGFHAASDYTDMVVFAEPNSGNDGLPLTGHLLDVRFHGPDWMTGGPRGTEASLFVFAVLAGLFFFFDRAYPARTGSGR